MKKRLCFLFASGCGALVLLPPWLASKEVSKANVVSSEPGPLLSSPTASAPSLQLEANKRQQDGTVSGVLIKSRAEQPTSDMTIPLVPPQQHNEPFTVLADKQDLETQILVVADGKDRADRNQKPQVNLEVQQSIQHEINQWSFTENSPINYSIDIAGLFEDPDDDLMTTQLAVNHPKFSVSNLGGETNVQGTPKVGEAPTQLIARAKDDYHGSDESAWVTTSFPLPSMSSGLEEDGLHPLIGETWYRLETNHQFAGKTYNYEKVYCEAFKFINDEVFFASSSSLTTCPSEHELRKVGGYHVDGNTLVVSSNQSIFDTDMRWKILETYPSHPTFTTAHVTQVKMGNEYETYTIASKAQIEQRINTVTGLEALQMTPVNYMYLANDGRYYLSWYGMHLSNYQQTDPTWPDRMDGDLNVQSYNTTVICEDLLSKFDHYSIGGQGVYGDIIGQTIGENFEPIKCEERPLGHLQYSFFDVDFLEFDEFKHGEVFSIILRPKKEWRHKVEEMKLNVRYLAPDA
ncbi:hypothetical protein [Vibrio splendidus]|uniref:hypothetical protein n=1 Tax=Vibrio splendidus TaxID=29497 RepID=UPI0021B4C7F4|nr:hypothetical protein [Vibrio splendidus]UWZ97217.1 hypothetical protein IM698_12615 [Vibrio splendidus]